MSSQQTKQNTPASNNTGVSTTVSGSSGSGSGGGSETPFPSTAVLIHATKIAIEQDRPVLFDYYVDTATMKAFIVEDIESKNKVLLKSREEYTSYIQRLLKVGDDYLVLTENSIYVVSGKITKKRVNLKQITGDDGDDIPISN